MSFLNKYKVNIGKGEVNEGSISGKVSFNFNKDGFYIYFNEIKSGYSHKKISNLNLKKKIIDEIKKGSNLAKYAAISVAANKKISTGQQIAASQRFAEAGRDKVVQKQIHVLEFSNGKNFFSIILDVDSYPNLVKDINLAYNNPKSFFNKSLENSSDFSNNKKGKIFWWIYWFVGFIILASLVGQVSGEDNKTAVSVLVFFVLLIYPIYQRFKNFFKGKSKVNDFKKTEEYQKALKDF